MRPVIHVVSTPALRGRYQRLLTSEWRKGTIDDVLELLWNEIEASARRSVSFLDVLDPHRASLASSGVNPQVIDELRHFRSHFHGNGDIPPLPETLPPRKGGRLRAQAETAWTYLMLDNLAHLSGET